ncbi:MAG: hypothetical protein WCJ11_02400 [Methylococcaceae bacterium]
MYPQTVSAIPMLLKLANVSKVATETVPTILNTITDNKIRLEGAALQSMVTLLKAAPGAAIAMNNGISTSVQKALGNNDQLSLDYINKLVITFQSAGVSDVHLPELLKQMLNNEHEIRKGRDSGFFSVAKWAMVCTSVITLAVIGNKKK